MSNVQLFKSYTAGAALAAYTLVKFSAAETVVAAAAVSDSIVGVSHDIAAAIGEHVDMVHDGIAFVVAGAAVAQGELLTSDASGRVVTAAPAAGTNNRTIGIAIEAATALGDVIRVLLSPGSFQG